MPELTRVIGKHLRVVSTAPVMEAAAVAGYTRLPPPRFGPRSSATAPTDAFRLPGTTPLSCELRMESWFVSIRYLSAARSTKVVVGVVEEDWVGVTREQRL